MRPGNESETYRTCSGPGVMQMAHGEPGICCVAPPVAGRRLPVATGAFGGAGTSIVMIFSTLPDVSVTWMRRLLRSAIQSRSSLSMTIECSVLYCPGPVPGSPNEPSQLPSRSYRATREFT